MTSPIPDGRGSEFSGIAMKPKKTANVRIYTLVVSLLQASGSAEATVLRTIQIRGDQTLADLHQVVCEAFCHEGDLLYEFQFGQEPQDPEGPRYVLAGAYDVSVADGTPAAGRVDNTTLDALHLKVGGRFAYLIDCGDDLWHQVHGYEERG